MSRVHIPDTLCKPRCLNKKATHPGPRVSKGEARPVKKKKA